MSSEDDFEEEFVEFCNGLPCVYLFGFAIVASVILIGVTSASFSLALIVVLCLLPTALVFYFGYVHNHLDSVSPAAVIHNFCWGTVGAFPVLSVQILSVAYFTGAWDLLGEPHEDADKHPNVTRAIFFALFQAYVVCATTEEALKYIIVTQFPGAELANRAYGVVVLCVAGGLGFATLENLGYVLFDDSNVSYFVALMRGIMDVGLHTVTATLIGVRVALKDHEKFSVWRILGAPFVIHGTYDVFLMLSSRLSDEYPVLHILPVISLGVLLASGYFALKQVQLVSEYQIIGQKDDGEEEPKTNGGNL